MGRRALRTGDLVQPTVTGSVLRMFATPESVGDNGGFTFGLYMGTVIADGRVKDTKMAFVFNSATMHYGWIQLRYLRRVE